jgi:hypothetical protein
MSEPAYNNDRRDAGPTELAAFHAALARLTPAPDGVNIARLLFRAGQLSAPRRSWAWPCATAASMMLAIALGSALLLRPAPQPVERIVTVYVPAASQPPPQDQPAIPSTPEMPIPHSPSASVWEGKEGSDGEYFQLRRQVLAHGLDALPPPQPWPAAMPTNDADTLLDLPRGSREPWLLRLKHSLQFGGSS